MTLADVPPAICRDLPATSGVVADAEGQLVSGLVFNLNGRNFVRDPQTPLQPGDRLLLLAADAGG
jgi:hypothetical protein